MCATLKMDRVTGVAMDGEIEQLQNDLKNAYHPFCFLG
jgi:hypothetical protein